MDYKRIQDQNRNRQMAQKINNRTGSAKGLSQKFDSGILSGIKPGNIGEINNVIWPFSFVFSSQDVNPGQSVINSFSVTQEAGFIMRSMTKQVYLKDTITGFYTYIDPFAVSESVNSANGLSFTLKDAQSSREFNGRAAQDIDTLGNANFPTFYPSTVFLLPNQTMQILFTNNHPTNVYRPYVVVSGYRIRVADAQNILSTVTG